MILKLKYKSYSTYSKFLLFFIFTLILFIPSIFQAQSSKYWLKHKYPAITINDKLWLGTPRGLYQYHPDEDTWTIYGTHSGLPANDIQILLWDEEYLWVATPKGIAYGDINLNKWIAASEDNELPSNIIYTIASQEDFIWVGTDKGAARFDKLIQEWELFSLDSGLPGSLVYDIAVDGDLVYFATSKGLAEYDVNFEKWRYYGTKDGIPSDTIRFIYPMTDYLWLFTDLGVSRFNKKLRTSLSFINNPRLRYSMINDLRVEGNQFWLATNDGVLIYDSGSNIWRPFQEEINLPGRQVEAMSFVPNNRWFITNKGIAAFNEKFRSWQQYDETQGLSSNLYEAVAVFRGSTFLYKANTIDYYNPTENRWKIYPLQVVQSEDEKESAFISLDKKKGSYIQINPDIRFSISGSRFTLLSQYTYDYYLDTEITDELNKNLFRGDLKGQLSLSGGRTVNGFYNNTDFSQTQYGIKYRGNKGDLVQEVNWGDIRYEQGKNNLIPSLGVFGSSARLEAGPKTERYKRSLVSAKATLGEKTTKQETEFFTGNIKSLNIELSDIDYIKNTFYLWDTTGIALPITEDSEEIFIDDLNPSNNTSNTLENYVIAGVSGDFDRLHPFIDYWIDYNSGEIRFLKSLANSSTIAIRAKFNGNLSERIIQNENEINQVRLNKYYVGGLEILPYTFRLEITDVSGKEYLLSDFGLDANNDGIVDPDWIDYQKGILTFPDSKPFPSSVYDPVNRQSVYRLFIEFKTEKTILNLSHNHLVRGSETLMVDGEILFPGEDYVLDYTSGSLLILKEGIVAEDSEIEITYEYYRDSDEKFYLAGIGYGPSDNVLMEVNYFSYDNEEVDSTLKRYNGLNFFGELKWKIHDLDLKLTPQIARSSGNNQQGNSMHIQADASSSKLRLFSAYEKYDAGFTPLFSRKFKLGKIYERFAIGGIYFPADYIDISGNWTKTSTPYQANGRQYSEENINGKVLLSKNLFPAISISGRQRILQADTYRSAKKTIRSDFEYEVSDNYLKTLSLKSLRFYGVWRKSWEDIDNSSSGYDSSQTTRIYENQYFRFEFSPMDLVQINSYYRGKSVKTQESSQNSEDRLLKHDQKIFFDATVDRLSGLNMNMRYQAEISEYFPSSGNKYRNYSLYRSLQSSIRFFPGEWIDPLTVFSFEFNYIPTWRGSIRNLQYNLKWDEKYWGSRTLENLSSSTENTLYQVRGEWRPSVSFFFNSSFEFYQIASQNLNSWLYTNIKRFNQKIEYRPSMYSLITLRYFRDHEEKRNYSAVIRNNPMIWLENRWTENLQTKLNISYLREDENIGKINQYYSSLAPLIGVTYRLRKSGSRQLSVELRNDLAVSFYRSNKSHPYLDHNLYSNTMAVDYYPLSVMFIRFRLVTTFKDILASNQDYISNLFEFRLNAQF